jgi:putative endopeptidase
VTPQLLPLPPGAPPATSRRSAYYASLIDEAAIEKAGLAPLQPELDAIAAIGTRADLSRAIARANREGGPHSPGNFRPQPFFLLE